MSGLVVIVYLKSIELFAPKCGQRRPMLQSHKKDNRHVTEACLLPFDKPVCTSVPKLRAQERRVAQHRDALREFASEARVYLGRGRGAVDAKVRGAHPPGSKMLGRRVSESIGLLKDHNPCLVTRSI